MKNEKQYITSLPDYGKVPPAAVDVEEALLGICLMYPDSISGVKLLSEMFYKNANQKIFKVLFELQAKADLVTVTNKLRDNGELESVGGPAYITQLISRVYSDTRIEYYAAIIKEKYLRREYIRLGQELQNRAFDDSCELTELIEYSESSLFQLSDFTQTREPEIISKCIDDVLIEIQKILNKEKSLTGIPSGFTFIDRITGGWQPGDLVIIAGRPSMGKTAFALTLTVNPSKYNYPVCFFSLEMSRAQIASRLLSGVSGYSNVEIRNAEVNFDKLVDQSNDIAMLPIFVDDTPAIGLFELRSKVKKMILKHNIKMIIVDYLQLMTGTGDSREQEISGISRGLKAIAKEFNIPVVALSQLNRKVEDRGNKRPCLADLRESGAIEQDADIVCFLFRPWVYNQKTIEIDGSEIPTKDVLIIDCAKDRNGALFTMPLYCNESLTVIQDKQFELNNEAF